MQLYLDSQASRDATVTWLLPGRCLWRHLYLHNVAENVWFRSLTAEGAWVTCNYTGLLTLTTQNLGKMCIPVITFKKTFGPIIFEQIIILSPNCYHGLPSSRACVLQNYDSWNPILSAQMPHMCAWVRLSFPYYRVRISECGNSILTVFSTKIASSIATVSVYKLHNTFVCQTKGLEWQTSFLKLN